MNKLLLFLFIVTFYTANAQTEDAWVFLKDKPNAASFFANPLQMLSQRSLDRRAAQNIDLDLKDVPIDLTYYNQLKNAKNITILGKSKWLNAIHVQGTESAISELQTNYSFISTVEFANKSLNTATKNTSNFKKGNHTNKFQDITTDYNYGNTANQVKMLNADFLHEQGFTGEGIQIAVIDAGFPNVNTLDGFKKLRDNNQILGGYNFADRNTNFYSRNNHGTHVLSTIAGYIENEFVGTAPNAKFYLFISEIAETETVLEETLWVEAAEKADSLGVDVINTSLGYTTFDNPDHNYTYADMDGKTTFISRGAAIGASRGMILVNSAGNSGNSSWKYIGAPADVTTVFSIGAVDASENIATFSSFGPTADNRIKPDVVAQGVASAIINYSSGDFSTANGTSFSSPIMAGVIACFWQANPNKTSTEIMDLIRSSANRFDNPTNQYGYGVPDFGIAYNTTLSLNEFANSNLNIFPNPVKGSFSISNRNNTSNEYSIELYTILGKKVREEINLKSSSINVSNLAKGVYFLKIKKDHQHKVIKLIKQ